MSSPTFQPLCFTSNCRRRSLQTGNGILSALPGHASRLMTSSECRRRLAPEVISRRCSGRRRPPLLQQAVCSWWYGAVAIVTWLSSPLFMSCNAGQFDDIDWCRRDPGPIEYADLRGRRHTAQLSYTRDGSMWFRFGPEEPDDWAAEWNYVNESRLPLRLDVIPPAVFDLLQPLPVGADDSGGSNAGGLQLNFTDYCALTDLQMELRVDRGWHPSYVTVFYPGSGETRTVMPRYTRDCDMTTRIRLDVDKQRLSCDAGPGTRTGCGQKGLPERGRTLGPVLLRGVNFDPMGKDRVQCNGSSLLAVGPAAGIVTSVSAAGGQLQQQQQLSVVSLQSSHPPSPPPGPTNSFTFLGTYYTVYVKVASCDKPRDSPSIGHDVTMRPNRDGTPNTIILTDRTQTVLEDSTVVGWRLFVKVMSIQHHVYLQVWRPVPHAADVHVHSSPSNSDLSSALGQPTSSQGHHHHHEHVDDDDDTSSPSIYTLVNQTHFTPTQLRAVEVPLDPKHFFRVRRGDVLGLYFPVYNPICWSPVPCGARANLQRYRLVVNPSNVVVGRTIRFDSALADEPSPCRHYSFAAIFANKTGVKRVDDWQCPSLDALSGDQCGRSHPAPPRSSLIVAGRIGGRGADGTGSPRRRDKDNAEYGDAAGTDDDGMTETTLPLLLITVGSLVTMLMVVGIASYCRAVYS